MDKKTSLIVFLGICCLALTIACIAFGNENAKRKEEIEKYETILDYACKMSGDYRTCNAGIEMLKGMDKKELEKTMEIFR